ncbi:hypothetical protein Tco_0327148 [Tanacetum coccineum]
MANLFPNDDANALVPNFNIEFVLNPGHAHFANNNNNNGWIEDDEMLVSCDAPNPITTSMRSSTANATHPQVQTQCRQLYINPCSKNQQWQTTVAEMHSREGTVKQITAVDGGVASLF